VLIEHNDSADDKDDRKGKLEDNQDRTKPRAFLTFWGMASESGNGFERRKKKRGITASDKPDKQHDRDQKNIHIEHIQVGKL
jgi:hypothetical protein